MFLWYPLMSGRVNYRLTGINNMPSEQIQNVTLSWVTIQGSVDSLCKEKKGEQNVRCPLLYITFFIYFTFFCKWLEPRTHIIILG